ncbi:cysteine hydrolase family protein [Roseateles sp. BYS180W]|uniref:Cysteine hydrolase family protein n=1 Tax=Roseateles rivi TaxID=3299028 RepID=A0ABW7FRV6_9BURK
MSPCPMPLDPRSTAVLVVDVQQALCRGGCYEVFEAAALVARINTLTQVARAAGVPVVLVQHEAVSGPMRRGEPGWELASDLSVQPSDWRLHKAASDCFQHTDLEQSLRAAGVRQLVVCGIQSDFCVDSTVRRALALGYEVCLVQDGHSTLDNGVLSAAQISAHHNATLCELSSYGPRARLVAAEALRFAAA